MTEQPDAELDVEIDAELDADDEDPTDERPTPTLGRNGDLTAEWDGDELVLTWVLQHGETYEAARFDRTKQVLTIFPREDHEPFSQIEIELPGWDPSNPSSESERYLGDVEVNGLPRGFNRVVDIGLGITRRYRGILSAIAKRTDRSILTFIQSGDEGEASDGERYRISLARFEHFRAAADTTRGRGSRVVRGIVATQAENAVAELFDLPQTVPRPGRKPEVQALTEAIANGGVTTAGERAALVDEVTQAAPVIGREAPEKLAQLRRDIDLVSLETLIERFEKDLETSGKSKDEAYWQDFFNTNQFVLQQLFAAPIVVRIERAVVGDQDGRGQGARATDFLCANTITSTAVVIEIKTPSTRLVEKKHYRGRPGHLKAVYAPDRELSGAVSQVLAQGESARTDFVATAKLEGIDTIRDLRCAVIIGTVSKIEGEARRASFLRYRAGLNGVTVIGYDEVLAQLRALLDVLQNGGEVIELVDVTND